MDSLQPAHRSCFARYIRCGQRCGSGCADGQRLHGSGDLCRIPPAELDCTDMPVLADTGAAVCDGKQTKAMKRSGYPEGPSTCL